MPALTLILQCRVKFVLKLSGINPTNEVDCSQNLAAQDILAPQLVVRGQRSIAIII